MITTKRSEGKTVNTRESERGGVALLERKEVKASAQATETVDQARARMQDNLEKLLNYDRYSEIKDSVATIEVPEKKAEKAMVIRICMKIPIVRGDYLSFFILSFRMLSDCWGVAGAVSSTMKMPVVFLISYSVNSWLDSKP